MIRTAFILTILAITASQLVESIGFMRLRVKRDDYLIPEMNSDNGGSGGYGRPLSFIQPHGSYPTPGQGGYPVPSSYNQGEGGYPVPDSCNQGQSGGYPVSGSINQGSGNGVLKPGSFIQGPGQGEQNDNGASNSNGWGTSPENNGGNTNPGNNGNSSSVSSNIDGTISSGVPRGSIEGIEVVDVTKEPDVDVTGEILFTESTTSSVATVVPENVSGEVVPSDNSSTTTAVPSSTEKFSLTSTVSSFSTEGLLSTEGNTSTVDSSTTTTGPFAPEEISSTTVGPFSPEQLSSTTTGSSFSTEGFSSSQGFPSNVDSSSTTIGLSAPLASSSITFGQFSTEGFSSTQEFPSIVNSSSTTSIPSPPEGLSSTTEFPTIQTMSSTGGFPTTAIWEKSESPSFPEGQMINKPFPTTVLPGMPGENTPSTEVSISTESFSSSTVTEVIEESSTTGQFPFSVNTDFQAAGTGTSRVFGIETTTTMNLNLVISTTEATQEGFFNNWGKSNDSSTTGVNGDRTGNNIGVNFGSGNGNVAGGEPNLCNCNVTSTNFDTCSCNFTSTSINGTLGVDDLPLGSGYASGNWNGNFGGSNQGTGDNQGISSPSTSQNRTAGTVSNVFAEETTSMNGIQGLSISNGISGGVNETFSIAGDGTVIIPEELVVDGSGEGNGRHNETIVEGSGNEVEQEGNNARGPALALKDNNDDKKLNSAPMSFVSVCYLIVSIFTLAIFHQL